MQKLGKSPNFGVISEIQTAKFGVFVIYIFGGKIWGSNKNFRGKIWGQAPRPPNMEVPPWAGALYGTRREPNYRNNTADSQVVNTVGHSRPLTN